MSDKEIIEAFRASNQRVLRLAYYDMKDRFVAFVGKYCSPLDSSSIEDVYHSSLIELQQNIVRGKLTENPNFKESTIQELERVSQMSYPECEQVKAVLECIRDAK